MGRAAAALLLAARAEDRPPAPEALILPHVFRPGESLAAAAGPDPARGRRAGTPRTASLRKTPKETET
jgi:hypothetical protein